ncbi:MAG: hypothetical protein KY432_04270, partial [Acidobacteria bacterium]|nr:hypothetical protein [Acidobacteriota bacterium]
MNSEKVEAGAGRNALQWREIVRFELVNQVRRGSLWFLFALFLFPLIGIITDSLMDARNHELVFNAPIFLAQHGLIMSTIGLLLMAVVAGDAATRDIQTRTEPLIHAAPLNRAVYVGGRFFGAFLTVAMMLVVIPLAQWLVPHFNPGVGAEVVGPVRIAAHLQTYFLLIVPNAFIGTALLFSLATLVRHLVGSYIGALIVFAAMQSSLAFVGGRLERWDLASLLDPTGITALSVMSRSWSPLELNERLVGSDITLLWNRLLWISISLAVLAFVIRRFRFGATAASNRWGQCSPRLAPEELSLPLLENTGGASRCHSERSEESGQGHRESLQHPRPDSSVAPEALHRNDSKGTSRAPAVVYRPTPKLGLQARVQQTIAIARDSLRELATPWTVLVLPLLALKVLLNVEAVRSMGPAGTRIFATTGRILEPLDDVAPPILIAIIMFPVIVAGEMLWRERDANMQSVADSTPVSNGARFAGKLLGLWSVIVAMHVLLMVAAVVAQVSLGWYDFEPALLFQIVLGLELMDALVFSLFALSIHILANQKHVGHLLVLLLIAAANITAEQFSVEHPLLLLGFEPEWHHSPISGFDPFLGPVLSFEFYWASWALLLALVARLFWVRGVERGMIERLRLARRRFSRRTCGYVAAALALVLLGGGFIFYNTNLLNAYESSDEAVRKKVEYERRYGQYERAPQPQIAATNLHVEIYPDRREANVRGVHRLVNRTAKPIDTIHVALSAAVETGEITFDRSARAARLDDELGHRIYQVSEPLQPGESVRMSWNVRHAPRGFPTGGISTAVVENGSFFVMQEWMPLIGYQPRRELTDAATRGELG